jgi:peptidyl-prolyl cis-trans isomerase B (cyclophilin B)
MSTRKRNRELARRKYERQQQRRQQTQAKRKHTQQIIAVIVVAALIVGSAAVWAFSTQSAAPVASPETEATPSPAESPSPATLEICTEPATPRANDVSFPNPPELRTFTEAPTITLATNCGDIVIQTLPELAPETVSSEVFLAESGFYDATACHRLTTAGIYVLQCGDPAGDGTGGPGYTVPDENFPAEGPNNYPAGTVAMANAGPGTSGSQFFLVYEDTTLPPAYTIWGTIVSGLDVVQAIAAVGGVGGAADGAPAQPIVINSATVSPGP